jgi:hypothetical protein
VPNPSIMDSVPIPMNHQVTPKPERRFRTYAVKPAAFAEQMRRLAMSGHSAGVRFMYLPEPWE